MSHHRQTVSDYARCPVCDREGVFRVTIDVVTGMAVAECPNCGKDIEPRPAER